MNSLFDARDKTIPVPNILMRCYSGSYSHFGSNVKIVKYARKWTRLFDSG